MFTLGCDRSYRILEVQPPTGTAAMEDITPDLEARSYSRRRGVVGHEAATREATMSNLSEQQQEQDKLDLDEETVQDLEVDEETAAKVLGASLGLRCKTVQLER